MKILLVWVGSTLERTRTKKWPVKIMIGCWDTALYKIVIFADGALIIRCPLYKDRPQSYRCLFIDRVQFEQKDTSYGHCIELCIHWQWRKSYSEQQRKYLVKEGNKVVRRRKMFPNILSERSWAPKKSLSCWMYLHLSCGYGSGSCWWRGGEEDRRGWG